MRNFLFLSITLICSFFVWSQEYDGNDSQDHYQLDSDSGYEYLPDSQNYLEPNYYSAYVVDPSVLGKTDTIYYYDESWFLTSKENASFYRELEPLSDNRVKVKDYYITGEIQYEATEKGNSRSDWSDASGATVENRSIEGEAIWYYKSGLKETSASYLNGGYHGEYKKWFENGLQSSLTTYQNNMFHGPYKEWYLNGTQSLSVSYKNGYYEGEYKTWFDDGKLSEFSTYKSGFLNGKSIAWHNNGVKKREDFYLNDKRFKTSKRWDSNGDLVASVKYGKENKIQKVYFRLKKLDAEFFVFNRKGSMEFRLKSDIGFLKNLIPWDDVIDEASKWNDEFENIFKNLKNNKNPFKNDIFKGFNFEEDPKT